MSIEEEFEPSACAYCSDYGCEMCPDSEKATLRARVAVLEGLLRDYRNSDCAHLGCYLGQYVNGRKHDYRCDVCMRTDSILAPAPLTEGQ